MTRVPTTDLSHQVPHMCSDPSHAHSPSPSGRPRSPLAWALRALVRGYQLVISPVIGSRCRYIPTCSQYAIEALDRHGALRGAWLTLGRLLRCHPWGGFGYDPVPLPAHSASRTGSTHVSSTPATPGDAGGTAKATRQNASRKGLNAGHRSGEGTAKDRGR